MNIEQRNNFLKSIYDFQVVKGNRSAQINRVDDVEFRNTLSLIEYWLDKGYLEKVAHASGYIVVKLTSRGIDYVEREL
jgi:hypothetical protein